MNTLATNPELMDIICNIQAMKSVICEEYDSHNDFKNLEKMSGDDLCNYQNYLIPLYNQALKNK